MTTAQQDVSKILGLTVPISVILTQRNMTVESLLEITVGTIIEFDMSFDAELAMQVVNQTIGRGQAVKIGENFGLRITQINSVSERIDAMGGG